VTPREIATFAIGPIGAAILGLLTLPVITWFFSQEDVGRIAMFQVTLSFGTLFFSLGLDQAYVREFHETENRPALLKSAILPGIVVLLTTLVVLLSQGESLAEWLFEVPKLHLSLLVALALLATFSSRFLSLVLRMNERGLAFSMSQVLPKLLFLVIIGSYVIFDADKSLTNLVAANAAAVTFVCTVFAWNTRKEWLKGLQEKLDVAQLKRMLQFGFPLILGGLAFWGLTATDKVFLRMFASYEELGVYSVAVSFAGAATILQGVFSTVWAPMVYKWASEGEGLENIQRVTRYVLRCVIVLFSLAGLLSWTVSFILPADYANVQWIVISCLGYPLLYTLSETTVVGIGISRRSSFAMLAAVVAFGFNLLGNWLLIPHFGAAGAAVSTCGAFLLFFILRTEFSCYLWRPVPRKLLYTYTCLIVSGAIVSTLMESNIGWMPYGFWGLVLLSTFLAFRVEFSELKGFIMKQGYANKV
jgi:O-antigen/teichoic acid export membrane protein